MEGVAALDHQLADALVAGPGECRLAEVAVRIGRVHAELTHLVAPLAE